MNKKTKFILSCIFGAIFLSLLLALAVTIPQPTDFQYTVFRIILSLAAAGIAAMIPGFLEVTISGVLRASGALAVFAVVYFFNPAALVKSSPKEIPTQAKPSDPQKKPIEQLREAPKQPSAPTAAGHSAEKSGEAISVPKPQTKKSKLQKSGELLLAEGDLIWQKTIENHALTWTEAKAYCNNLGLGGYDDWRLPTIRELESLVDKRYSPSINPSFGALPAGKLPFIWSSTIDPNDDGEAQFMNFKNGLPAHINKERGYGLVRCVRHG